MRPPEVVRADMKALGRPGFACGSPKALEAWKEAIAQWRAVSGDGEARYEALLAELDAWDAATADEKRRGGALDRWADAVGVPRRPLQAAQQAREEAPLTLARDWWTDSRPEAPHWLVLMGGTGTGKSTAAAWVLLQARALGLACLWVDSARLAGDAGGFDASAQAYAERCRHVDVLALDDYGTEHASDWARSVLGEVLQARHEAGLRTVITTNLDGKAFAARLGARLADRVRSACKAGNFPGPSLRATQAPTSRPFGREMAP